MRVALLGIVALLVGGCAGRDRDPAAERREAADAAFAFCMERSRLDADRAIACRTAAASVLESALSREVTRFGCEQDRSAVAEGRMRYDAAAAAGCLSALAGLACEVQRPLFMPAGCRSALDGTVARGGACVWFGDCADGWCEGLPGGCAGTCMGPYALDEACLPGQCALELACDQLFTDRCVPASPPGASGEPCGGDRRGPCFPGLYCGADAKCTPLAAAGEPCSRTTQCAVGTYCTALPGGVGSCVSYAREGESCEHARCASGARCDVLTLFCVPEPLPGEPCHFDVEPFEAGFCLDAYCGDDGICHAPPRAGEPCTISEQCADWQHACVNGVCAPVCDG